MNACPPRDRLRLFLAERLPEDEARPVEAHVETCVCCQDVLADLSAPEPSAGPESVAELADFGPEPRPEFLRRLREAPATPATDVLGTLATGAASAPTVEAEGSDRPPPGPRVAGYEILGVLGRGGLAVVYQARHLALGRLVALKMILAGTHASANDRARFRAEAEVVARLRHPNIIQIFEVGEQDGCSYLALEFVDGGTLAQSLQGNPLPVRTAAGLAETLARAVQHAHEHGVVHRDLKPANILLSFSREPPASALAGGSRLNEAMPRITDFGLARSLDRDRGQTQTGAILGTPSYMAPEQAAGRRGQVGPAADIYSLGALLYEMLTGRPPFRGESMADTLQQVQFGEAVPPSRLQPKVPRDLETICLKCLHREPARRYASAEALADDLKRFLAGEPIRARPTPAWERAAKWVRRRPALATLFAVSGAALLLLIGSTVSFTVALRAETEEARRQQGLALEERARARDQEIIAQQQGARARAESAAARRLVYAADVARASHELRDVHDLARVLQILNPYDRGPQDPDDLRGWEWYYLTSLCHRGVRIYNSHHPDGGGLLGLAVSPDGRWVAAAVSGARRVCIFDAVDRGGMYPPARELTGPAGPVAAVAFSPDNRLLAFAGSDRTVRLWSTGDWKERCTMTGHAGDVHAVAFSPDGRSLVSAGADGTVRLWQAGTGNGPWRSFRVLRGHDGAVRGAAFSLDGRLLASAGADATVRLWRAADGTPVHTFRGHEGSVNGVGFSPDGRLLASAGADHTVRLWDLHRRRELDRLPGHTEEVRAVAFRPDGRQLASAGLDACLRLWDTATRRETSCLVGHWSLTLNGVAYAPDGAHVLDCSDDGTIRVWHADEPTPNWRNIVGQDGDVTCAAFNRDGSLLATGGAEGLTIIWDDTGTVRNQLPAPLVPRPAPAKDRPDNGTGPLSSGGRSPSPASGGWVTAVAFSPDGRLLASATSAAQPFDLAGPPRKGAGIPDARLRLWDVASGRALRAFPPWTHHIQAVAFSRDGRLLAAAGAWTEADPPAGHEQAARERDWPIKLWDVGTGQEVQTLRGHQAQVNALAFTRDGRRLISGSDDRTVRAWDLSNGQQRVVLPNAPGRIYTLALDPADRHLATVTRTAWEVHVWDMETGARTQRTTQHRQSITGLAYSPDGRRLFTVSQDRSLKVWDTVNGQELLTLWGHDHAALGLACSTDGRQLASVGQAGEVRVWDAPTLHRVWWSGLERIRQPEQLLAWHRREAAAAEAAEDWYGAAWHLDRLLAQEPASAALRARRDRVRTAAGAMVAPSLGER